MDEVMQRISSNVMKSISMDKDIEDAELYSCIDEALMTESRKNMIPISERERYRKMIFNSMKRLDILQDLLEDTSISEIMINGYKDIYIEKNGSISRCGKEFETQGKLEDLAQKIAGLSNRIVNESKPIVDTRLADGSRVNIVLSPAAIDGPVITVRKFYDKHLTMKMLTEMGSLTEEAAFMLKKLVSARYNIFVSGGTGSGKTTFLNALSDFIPEDERIITIEDSAELKLNSIKNLVRLEARNENVEGTNAITIRDLIKTSLRMRPDRIIVGEVRGEEALDMLNAMNTGHLGFAS